MRQLFITGTSRGFGLALTKQLETENTRITGLSRSRGDFRGNHIACDLNQTKSASETLDQTFAQANWQDCESIIFVANSGILNANRFSRAPFDKRYPK